MSTATKIQIGRIGRTNRSTKALMPIHPSNARLSITAEIVGAQTAR
jgi:hypothetical protein